MTRVLNEMPSSHTVGVKNIFVYRNTSGGLRHLLECVYVCVCVCWGGVCVLGEGGCLSLSLFGNVFHVHMFMYTCSMWSPLITNTVITNSRL